MDNIDNLTEEMGYKVGGLPSTYLGLHLVAPFKSVAIWDGVKERFHKRLAMWKRRDISKGGRLTLIQSTLSSMPIYVMSLFCIPRQVRLRLEKIQRDFLCGGGALVQKPHLVRRKIVCSERNERGLGVRCLLAMNKTLLCKWSRHFAIQRRALWKLVIGQKYGEDEKKGRGVEIR